MLKICDLNKECSIEAVDTYKEEYDLISYRHGCWNAATYIDNNEENREFIKKWIEKESWGTDCKLYTDIKTGKRILDLLGPANADMWWIYFN